MTSIEINGSFYSLQRPSSYRSWREQVPDDFVFAVKGGRFITHMKKLRDAEQPLANFFASGVLALGPTLGPLLWQLPENLPYDRERLEQFFAQLPRTHAEAAALAARHDDKVPDDRALTTAEHDGRLRHVLEFRSESYCTDEAFALLREHDIGCVVAETAGRWPQAEAVTSDLRLRPAARRHRALRQRLHRRGARPVGRRSAGPGRRPATCASTSTTTPRDTRPTTRSGCSTACVDTWSAATAVCNLG